MALFSVPIVEESREPLWRERWQDEPTFRALEANRDGSLSRTVTVSANSKTEAANVAEKANPGCVAIRDAIQKHESHG